MHDEDICVDGTDVEQQQVPAVNKAHLFDQACCYRFAYFWFVSFVAFVGMIGAAMLLYLFDHVKVA